MLVQRSDITVKTVFHINDELPALLNDGIYDLFQHASGNNTHYSPS